MTSPLNQSRHVALWWRLRLTCTIPAYLGVSLEELDDPLLDPAAARPQIHARLLIQLIRVHLQQPHARVSESRHASRAHASGMASFLPPSYIMTLRHTATSAVYTQLTMRCPGTPLRYSSTAITLSASGRSRRSTLCHTASRRSVSASERGWEGH